MRRLIDGMAVARWRDAALAVRMLDARGETLAQCSATPEPGAPVYGACAGAILAAAVKGDFGS